jgi:hypothetical protein
MEKHVFLRLCFVYVVYTPSTASSVTAPCICLTLYVLVYTLLSLDVCLCVCACLCVCVCVSGCVYVCVHIVHSTHSVL